MRNLRRALLAVGSGFAVSCIAACGGGAGLLSGDQANTLNNQLNQLSAELTSGHCSAARAAAQGLVQKVAALPSTVDARLRQDLDLGAVTISQLAAKQCHQVSTATTTPTTTSTTPTATNTTTTPATTTHTTTTTTTTPATPPTTTGSNSGPSGGSGLGGSGNSSGNGSGAAGGAQQNGGNGPGANNGGNGNG